MLQTINHRRLVGEVYNKGVLHNILGVKPKAQVVVKELDGESYRDKHSKSPSLGLKNKYSPWKDLGGGDASLTQDISDLSHRNNHDPDESAKYDIGKQPPKKRKRMGREEDKHAVFIVDDENGSRSDSTDVAEAKEYGKSMADTDAKRSYWLSKARGLGEDQNDSE